MAFTYFFRDQQTLDLIAQHVLPDLKRHMYINIWDAGCAMGPEPYSLAITLRENMGPFLFRNVHILATDIDESGEFGNIIQRGIYTEQRVKRIPAPLLTRYFTPIEDAKDKTNYQISAEMRKVIHYQQHDLLTLTPIRDNLGLIVCKNVLLHLAPEERVAVIQMFHAALAPGGYLVTEQTQKLPVAVAHTFKRVSNAGQLFQKIQEPWSISMKPHAENNDQPVRSTSRPTVVGTKPKKLYTRSDIAYLGGTVIIQQDRAFSHVSNYVWLNIERASEQQPEQKRHDDRANERLGKLRVDMVDNTLKIYSLTIYPKYQKQGYAREVVHHFQATYPTIIADSVRPEARPFWEKLGFINTHDGHYKWVKTA